MSVSLCRCLSRFASAAVVAAFLCGSGVAAKLSADGIRLTSFSQDEAVTDRLRAIAAEQTLPPTLALALDFLTGGLFAGGAVFFGLRRRLGRRYLAAERSERRFVDLARQTSDVVLRVRDDNMMFSDDGRLGYGAGDLACASFERMVHPDDRDAVRGALAWLVDGEVYHLTFRLLHRTGGDLWMDAAFCRYSTVDDAQETIVTMRDVTRQRDEAERLMLALERANSAQTIADQANRAKGEFLASMSHEIRTPLNAIIGFADLLLVGADLNISARRNAERIRAGGDALLTIVNDVLDYSQMETGNLRLNPRPFALPLLVDECVALVERLAITRNLALRVNLPESMPAGVRGDEARVRQVLLNLMNNAIKFTERGVVTVSIHPDPAAGLERVRFEVSDTGIGISEADVTTLFQRFRQVDGAMSRSYGGIGLGLAISKMLVERMGGEIGVRSTEGVGSTFWFTIDLPTVPLTLEAAPGRVQPLPSRQLRILLVEDIRINQELARAILEARTHHVEVVGDGADAIMAVEHEDYDLVLMDVQMPYVDGMTATRAIRRLPVPARFVPIVAMTAHVLREQTVAIREAGMDDVLGKPLSIDEIDALLDRAGRAEIQAAPDAACFDRAVVAKLADVIGEAKVESMFATLASSLAKRFVVDLTPATTSELRAEAHASIAGAAMLGFVRFSSICRQFVDAETVTQGQYRALLRELGDVVRSAEPHGGSRHLTQIKRVAA